jgi:hypothetical protein
VDGSKLARENDHWTVRAFRGGNAQSPTSRVSGQAGGDVPERRTALDDPRPALLRWVRTLMPSADRADVLGDEL